jgi:co-chaperonin GroES (HSP10)
MIVPLLHRILVKPDLLEEKDETYRRATASGIVIPNLDERSREQAAIDTGKVVSIGSTAFKDFGTDSPIATGDYVVYAKYGGKAVTDPETSEKFILLNDEDVLGLFKEKEAMSG